MSFSRYIPVLLVIINQCWHFVSDTYLSYVYNLSAKSSERLPLFDFVLSKASSNTSFFLIIQIELPPSPLFVLCFNALIIWGKVFENGPNKIYKRQPLKNLKGYGLLSRPYASKLFKCCFPQILLDLLLNTLSHISFSYPPNLTDTSIFNLFMPMFLFTYFQYGQSIKEGGHWNEIGFKNRLLMSTEYKRHLHLIQR